MGEKINKEIKLKHIVGALSDKQFYSLAHMILLVIALLGSLLAIGLIVFFVIIGGKARSLPRRWYRRQRLRRGGASICPLHIRRA